MSDLEECRSEYEELVKSRVVKDTPVTDEGRLKELMHTQEKLESILQNIGKIQRIVHGKHGYNTTGEAKKYQSIIEHHDRLVLLADKYYHAIERKKDK